MEKHICCCVRNSNKPSPRWQRPKERAMFDTCKSCGLFIGFSVFDRCGPCSIQFNKARESMRDAAVAAMEARYKCGDDFSIEFTEKCNTYNEARARLLELEKP